MRVMVMTKGAGADEDKAAPTQGMFELMQAYNQQLVEAGIMLGGEGLRPSTEGALVVFSPGETSVVDGPFTESKEVIAGYWIWEVSSLEEAVAWAQRCPYDPQYGDTQVLEIRPFFEMGDFEGVVDEETLVKEQQLRDRASGGTAG